MVLTGAVGRAAAAVLIMAVALSGTARAEVKRGTSGPDDLSGTSVRDELYGYGGNDQFWGYGGDDYIVGGTGDEVRMLGYGGYDWIQGDDGYDLLQGDSGGDVHNGGNQNDTIYAADGYVDDVYGNAGYDSCTYDNYDNEYCDTRIWTAASESGEVPEVSLALASSDDVMRVSSPAVTADSQGRVAIRFRSDPRGRDWTRRIETSFVAAGNAGSIVRDAGTEGWPEGVGTSSVADRPWQAVRQFRDDMLRHHSEGIRALEQRLSIGRVPAESHAVARQDLAEQRAQLDRERAAIAPDGVCLRSDRPNVIAVMTRSLGERVYLACGFQPGERVRAELTFGFTGEALPSANPSPEERQRQIEDLKRRNAELRQQGVIRQR